MAWASNRQGWLGLAAVLGLLAAFAAFAAGGLNDTGQTTCYDDTSPVSPEPSTHPRQDCTIGRDAAAADGVLPKTGAGSKGFDYTKIASNGSVLPASATSWSCVLDNLTGLTWEVKTNDGGLRDWKGFQHLRRDLAQRRVQHPGLRGGGERGRAVRPARLAAAHAAGVAGAGGLRDSVSRPDD